MDEVKLLPSKDLFFHGTIPEPLNEEARRWLARQLHEWPNRVDEDRTCAIGALTDMAVTEFCRLMAEQLSRPTTVVTDEVVVSAAAAIVDIWMGGDTAWRARLDDSDFLESADWQNALELAHAALNSMPTVVTGEQSLQSVGDHALPPSGLSRVSPSQAKPAAAIASSTKEK